MNIPIFFLPVKKKFFFKKKRIDIDLLIRLNIFLWYKILNLGIINKTHLNIIQMHILPKTFKQELDFRQPGIDISRPRRIQIEA